nr:NAD(P)H-binding protein [Mycobacterium sp. 852002-51971_SCH5477799-a]
MRIFVTGATGAIGRYAVPVLVGAGHTVSALARTSAKAATLSSQGTQAVSVSLFDRALMWLFAIESMTGHDTTYTTFWDVTDSGRPSDSRKLQASGCSRRGSVEAAAAVWASRCAQRSAQACTGGYRSSRRRPSSVMA